MEAGLVTLDGESLEVTPERIRDLMATAKGFWLDLAGLDADGAEQLLGDTFGFHPLAVEDAEHFGQRPKVDGYDDFTFVVVYGATTVGDLVEVHCFYSASFLVTVHREPCPELTSLFEKLRQRPGLRRDLVMVLYRVIDVLVDGYFPVLAGLDDEIDELEDQILERPTDHQLGQLFEMKRSLIAMRKVVTPQRDMFAGLLGDGAALPGMTGDAERYFRDVYDHLIRISDLIDSYRDLLTGALDTHLSTVSNRLNVVMKQLTIIATVFLPLSFLTGFFGQNFAWLVARITTLPVFLGAGIGLEILAAVALMILFRQRGWLTFDGMVPTASGAARARVDREHRWHALRVSPHDRRHGSGTGPPSGP